jgi:curved DNA-binding protein CbpA
MNHYEILGVGPEATEQLIKEAYRREAMKWHPDRHDGAAAKGEADRQFKDLALAYRTLRSTEDRAEYDRQLEQKLHQAYSARQQEQAKQQKAHDEPARQQQTRQEPPSPDFASTGSQFEEETVSGDDANQMFFEQMLDLAFELAGRGFPEDNIFKALIALGCPESMARSVAMIAAKRGRGNDSVKPPMQRYVPAIKDFDKASWEELEPYYAAAIMGNDPREPLSKTRYNAVQVIRTDRGNFCLGIGFIALVIGLIFGAFGSIKMNEVLSIVALIESAIAIIAIFAMNLFLGPDKKRYFANKPIHYYLDRFKSMHLDKKNNQAIPSFNLAAGVLNVYWLGYRRHSLAAYSFILLYLMIGIAFIYFDSGKYADLRVPASILLSVLIGLYGNWIYFRKVQSKIRNALNNSSKVQALRQLSKHGGVNRFGWMLPMLFVVLLGLFTYAIQMKMEVEKERFSQESKASQLAAENAVNENRQRAADQQAQEQVKIEYDKVLANIETRYPQLNPDSPYYNSAALSWVADRKKFYDQAGDKSPIATLQQAAIDYSNALKQNKN